MKNLLATLHDCDPGMLPALAEVWDVDSKSLSHDDLIRQLRQAMLDPQRVEAVWDKLDEAARTALQLLVSSEQRRMKVAQFERFYGELRKLGRAQIVRDKPHVAGRSLAETLYYRGFIGEGFDKVGGNLLGFVYIPSDLVEALPLHKTSYETLAEHDVPLEADRPTVDPVDDVDEVNPADTSIVDDTATLLAWLQVNEAEIASERFTEAAVAAFKPLLLRPLESRLSFILGICLSANLLSDQDSKVHVQRDAARDWLKASRSDQIRALALAWLESRTYREMWHIPGLYPEDSGWTYDPAAARKAVMELLGDLLPEQGWVSINDLIEIIKEFEPDFQRLDGDYERWYIRNDAGEYLSGFESWDAVEGSLIEFYIVGPMHWLGLVDIGEDVLRPTAYGRAFLQLSDWPRQDAPKAAIEVRNDGQLLATRRVDRFERFQLARFARCRSAGDPYVYQLDAQSIQRAAAQGISTRHIQAFISRHLAGKPMPLPIVKLLRSWQDGARTAVTFESHIVLRTTSEETMEKIFASPAIRRFLGARLGPMACVVRADQWEALRLKLGEFAIEVDVSSLRIHAD